VVRKELSAQLRRPLLSLRQNCGYSFSAPPKKKLRPLHLHVTIFSLQLLESQLSLLKMLRRQARERRDYLHRRALQLRDAAIAEKRQQLKKSLATGKPLSKDIADDKSLKKDYKYDESLDAARETIDDEYALLSGLTEPRPLVTTSRSPSTRLSAFSKEIRLLLSDIILLHEHRGTPTALTVSHLPHGPTASFSLHNVMLRADIPNASRGTVSESYPHLIFEGFTTKLGLRVVQILKHLFPPRDGPHRVGNRVVTFKNVDDSIEVRHHVFVQTGYRDVELAEVGPRMTMRCFEIRGGTLDKDSGGEKEWALGQYLRTSRKKNYL
jgi:U3 small nucleolar ribonucleoprotein protein IMP4